MRYFLKRTERKKGEYLQIYQSEYIRGVGSRNRSYKAIGYVDELIARGIKDPAAKAQEEKIVASPSKIPNTFFIIISPEKLIFLD